MDKMTKEGLIRLGLARGLTQHQLERMTIDHLRHWLAQGMHMDKKYPRKIPPKHGRPK